MAMDDRHSSTSSDSSSSSSDHLRDMLRLVRCVDKVEITGTSYNWDAKKCFVLMVYLRDTDARKQAFARGETRNSPEPFQVERTPGELTKLWKAMRQWSGKLHPSNKVCDFCGPIASGALVAEALRTANETPLDDDVYEAMSADDMHITSCCFGFLPTKVKADQLRPETDDEWEAWLNACLAHVRASVSATVDAADVCDGMRHVPSLLVKFLLDGFLSNAIPY